MEIQTEPAIFAGTIFVRINPLHKYFAEYLEVVERMALTFPQKIIFNVGNIFKKNNDFVLNLKLFFRSIQSEDSFFMSGIE